MGGIFEDFPTHLLKQDLYLNQMDLRLANLRMHGTIIFFFNLGLK